MLVAHGQGGGNGEVPLFRSILHRCNLARGEMMHFVSNLSNFIMFAVGRSVGRGIHTDRTHMPRLFCTPG